MPFCRDSRGLQMPSAVSGQVDASNVECGKRLGFGDFCRGPRTVVLCDSLPILRKKYNILCHCFFGYEGLSQKETLTVVNRLPPFNDCYVVIGGKTDARRNN